MHTNVNPNYMGHIVSTFLIFSLQTLASESSHESPVTHVTIEKHENVQFSLNDIFSDRDNEKFDVKSVGGTRRVLVEKTVREVVSLLEPDERRPDIKIIFETDATVTRGKFVEKIPVSLVLTQQVPPQNSIRFGTFEIENDEIALRSILAHETGHMIMEWVARKSGKVTDQQMIIPFWSKAIYEGIADFASACVTGNTEIGHGHNWFSRDILKYKNLSEALHPSTSTVENIKSGFESSGLTPKYKFYDDLVAAVTEAWDPKKVNDPYTEGTWVAGQLWNLSNSCSNRSVWKILAGFARSGDNISDSAKFIGLVKKQLY